VDHASVREHPFEGLARRLEDDGLEPPTRAPWIDALAPGVAGFVLGDLGRPRPAKTWRWTVNYRIFVAVALGLILAACQDPPTWRDDYDFVWYGKYVTLYGYDREAEEACGGSMEFLDDYVVAVADYLGYGPDVHIDYRWMPRELVQEQCGPVLACAYGPEVRSPWLPHMHEVSHAVSHERLNRNCTPLLEEGLAEYLSDPRFESLHVDAVPELPGDIEEMLTTRGVRGSQYPRAGHFVSFLVETYGIEAVIDLCRDIPWGGSREDWEYAVQDILGLNVDELLAVYADYPLCSRQQYRARLLECNGEVDLTLGADAPTHFRVAMDCASKGTIGPINGQVVAIVRVRVEQNMWASVWIETDDGAVPRRALSTWECAACSAKPRNNASVVGIEPPANFRLRKGLHSFLFFRPVNRPETFNVTITPIETFPDEDD
jgi:hypothetical protein